MCLMAEFSSQSALQWFTSHRFFFQNSTLFSLVTIMFSLSIRALVSAAGSAAIVTALDVVAKDVVVIGGGASGAYAAFRLREDYGQSIALIEKEETLVSTSSRPTYTEDDDSLVTDSCGP
jgi:FAD dependent oxidoreductase